MLLALLQGQGQLPGGGGRVWLHQSAIKQDMVADEDESLGSPGGPRQAQGVRPPDIFCLPGFDLVIPTGGQGKQRLWKSAVDTN